MKSKVCSEKRCDLADLCGIRRCYTPCRALDRPDRLPWSSCEAFAKKVRSPASRTAKEDPIVIIRGRCAQANSSKKKEKRKVKLPAAVLSFARFCQFVCRLLAFPLVWAAPRGPSSSPRITDCDAQCETHTQTKTVCVRLSAASAADPVPSCSLF